ncbi:MAG: hypothetical protein CFE43_19540 [Burkholderiales bacterium PBB3]|nr:MAG: hypothetical protein CFE43_19540 [Burkholderiales bacterium PBB3]
MFSLAKSASATQMCVLVLLMCTALPALAVNRCKDAQGNVTFSDTPCTNAAEGGKIDLKPATGDGANAAGRTYTPPKSPPTVAGRQARLAALDDAISSLTRQMEKDSVEGAAAIDKVYKDMAAASKAAETSNMGSEAVRASMAISQSNIQGVSRRYSEKMRESEWRLTMLKAERESILRAK